MERLVTAKQMKEIDRFSIKEIGIPSMVLMERAAMAVTERVCRCLWEKLAVFTNTPSLVAKEDCLDFTADKTNGTHQVKVACICGYGNNGGDGAAVARMLNHKGIKTDIWMVGPEERATGETKEQLMIAENLGISVRKFEKDMEFDAYTVLVDAIFGIGLTRPVEGIFAAAVEKINASGAWVIAVDIPSGVSADSGHILGAAVKAQETVTFGYRKAGQILFPAAAYCGDIICADIGFPKVAELGCKRFFRHTKEDFRFLPIRPAYSNKGTFGKVLIVAGSAGMSGAAYFSASAAYHMGAGSVRIVTDEGNFPVLAAQLPEALLTCYRTDALEEKAEPEITRIRNAVMWADVVVIGPGIGKTQAARNLLHTVLAQLDQQPRTHEKGTKQNEAFKPCVLDADALNLLAEEIGYPEGAIGDSMGGSMEERLHRLAQLLPEYTILTPHLLELSRLINLPVSDISSNLIDIAGKCTYNNKLVYVIKDARTIIASKDRLMINTSGCSGMATGGSGDVLTGIIAGLLAGGTEPETAASLGVYLHGSAGSAAADELTGRYMLAGDILQYLPRVLKEADALSGK